jgi:predicted metal-dependent HD superfamily phosphohydrolase
MLACLDARRAEVADAVSVELAVFFHDWMYEPQGSANEAESVLEFVKFADDAGLGDDMRARVVGMVEATVGHAVGDVEAEKKGDMQLFLDFDLEVLGRSWAEYEVYAGQIRKEYQCYDDEEYTAGRIKVLKGFLERERVYFSEWFHREKAEIARTNLLREIELLEHARPTAS